MNSMFKDKALLVILGFALIIRLVSIGPFHAGGYTSDEREYVYLAKAVASGQEFIDSNGEKSKRSPLYPITLGYLFKFFGESLWLPPVIGCLLGTLIVALGYILSMKIWDDRQVALFAAGAMAVYPGLVIYSVLLQTEMLYIVFMLVAFISAFKLTQLGDTVTSVILGATSGLAALTRAVFLGFFPLLLLLIVWKRASNGIRKIFSVAVALALFCLVLTPWTVRNYSIHGTLVPISSWGGESLLIGNNPFATGTWSVKPGFNEWFNQEASKFGVADIGTLSEVGLRDLDRTIALDYMKTHPLQSLRLAVKKGFIFLVYPITNSDSYWPVQAAAVGSDFLLYIGAVVGLVATWDNRRRLVPLYAAFMFFGLVQIVLHAEARYRLPLVPLICLFFGWGVAIVADRARRLEFFANRKLKIVAGALISLTVLVYCFTGWFFLEGKV